MIIPSLILLNYKLDVNPILLIWYKFYTLDNIIDVFIMGKFDLTQNNELNLYDSYV